MTTANTNFSGGLNRGRRICVVGGGIGGLTAALAFAASGAEVQVLERAEAFSDVGAGIQITPNGMRVLDALGIGRFVPQIGVVSDAVVPVDGLTGRVIARFDLTGQRPRYHFVHRARLVDLLAGACREHGIPLRTGCRVVSATPEGRVTFVEAREGRPDLQWLEADLVVFADGIKSVGRGLVGTPSDATFTGQVAWRAMVDGTAPPQARIVMGPGRHLVTYPLAENRLNIVAVQERADWAEEGWSQPDDPENLRAAFADFAPEVTALLQRVENVNLWGLFRHPVAEHWQSGRLALLGDAAHPSLPFLAQGANLAIEDAMVLARCCDRAMQVPVALKSYQATRRPRVVRAIAAANANARNYHLSGIRRRVAHAGLTMLGRVAPDAFIDRLGWIYGYDATAAPLG